MWIVLNDLGSFYTFNEFPCKQPIGGQLVVSVLRDSDASLGNQNSNAVERLTHYRHAAGYRARWSSAKTP